MSETTSSTLSAGFINVPCWVQLSECAWGILSSLSHHFYSYFVTPASVPPFLGDDSLTPAFSHFCIPTSALYVVDLKKFRKIAAGDRLRGQYQALSQDPNSLSNLDQVSPRDDVISQYYVEFVRTCAHLRNMFLFHAIFRTFLTTWSTRWPSSLFHRSGCGVRRGVTTPRKSQPRR